MERGPRECFCVGREFKSSTRIDSTQLAAISSQLNSTASQPGGARRYNKDNPPRHTSYSTQVSLLHRCQGLPTVPSPVVAITTCMHAISSSSHCPRSLASFLLLAFPPQHRIVT